MGLKKIHECEGSFTAIATPFKTNQDIDIEALQEHMQWLKDKNSSGALLFGTTGEANSIALSKRIEAIGQFQGMYKANTIFVGIGATALGDSLALAEAALKAGYNQLLCLPPFFYKGITDEGLYDYFASIINCMKDNSLRLYLYHIPQLAGVGIPPAVMKRLQVDFPDNVVGIKDSSGDFNGYAQPLMNDVPLSLFIGDDNHLLATLKNSGPGCITALANVIPHIHVEIINAYKQGKIDEAQDAQNKLTRWREFIKDFSPIVAIKYIIQRRTKNDIWKNNLLPHTYLSPDQKSRIDAFIDQNV